MIAEKTIYGYPESQLELIDGKYYTLEDGDFGGDQLPEAFTIDNDQKLDWAMEKIQDAEAELLAIDAQYRAIIERYEGAKKRKQALVDWRRGFFGPLIENYAKTKLDGKTKYVETPFGRCQWRTKKGGLRVADKDLALEFAKAEGFTGAIKVTESFLISGLTDMEKSIIAEKNPDGFLLEFDSETFDINTGVGK